MIQEPILKLALEVLGWGLLAVLSFFFQVVGFVVIAILLVNKFGEFNFVYQNTRGFPYDAELSSTGSAPRYEQLAIPGIESGAEMGTNR